jgi:hypothetical protein
MQIEEMTREQLLKIVRRLPLTADGVPVVPGMEVWVDGTAWSNKGDRAWNFYDRPFTGEIEICTNLWCQLASKCYSTREAALAAREAKPC